MGNFRKRNINDVQIIVTALPIHENIFPSKTVLTLQGFQIFATVVDLTIVKSKHVLNIDVFSKE